jgi:hypothetical protein
MRPARHHRTSVLVLSILAACGGSDGAPPEGELTDGGDSSDVVTAKNDAATDAPSGVDAEAADVTVVDATADVELDTSTDSQTDALGDGAVDSSIDGASDAGSDAATDTGADVVDAGVGDASSNDAADAGGCSTAFLQGLTVSTVSVSDGRDWENTTNAITSNNAYARVSSMVNGEISDYLTVTDFVPAIPVSSTITGISVSIERQQSAFSVNIADNLVRLVVGGAIAGQNKASGAAWTTTDTTITYGGPSDLWGLALTPADVNASNFGAAISVAYASTAGNADARIDAIKVQIHYTCP